MASLLRDAQIFLEFFWIRTNLLNREKTTPLIVILELRWEGFLHASRKIRTENMTRRPWFDIFLRH